MSQKGFGNTARAFNIGCGPEIFENGYQGYDQWRNVDSVYKHPQVENVDMRYARPIVSEGYDFALINHVLCTMRPEEALIVLNHTYDILRPGATIQVIDVDIMKAFDDYLHNEGKLLPIQDGNKDYNMCMHLSGYGTRLSLYTTQRMMDDLAEAGFKEMKQVENSPYNTRPTESLVIQATK